MSSTTTVTTPAKAELPQYAPIDILDNGIARIYTHIHPLLLLSLFYFQFNSLIANPVRTLLNNLIPLALLQIAYCVLCLPPTTGSGSVPLPAKPAGKKSKNVKGKDDLSVMNRVVPAIYSLLLSAFFGMPVITFGLILFGAPLTTHAAHTVLCAAHMAYLAAIPLVYVHGVDPGRWKDIASLSIKVDEVFGCAVGMLMGAWVGAVPIPLDWDREWQAWPITIVTGAYIGYAVGKLAGGLPFKGKKIEFN